MTRTPSRFRLIAEPDSAPRQKKPHLPGRWTPLLTAIAHSSPLIQHPAMACACFAALFLLLAWSGPQVAQTLSTCAPHNSSEMTRRRLEAVRGQILSKLRLADLPEPGQGAVPEEILSLYNASLSWPGWNSDSGSTRCERTGSAEVDEYYAREMRRVTCHSGAGSKYVRHIIYKRDTHHTQTRYLTFKQ